MMSLNTKTTLFIIGALVWLLAVTHLLAHQIFLDSFLRLEREDALRRLEQSASIISQSAEDMLRKAGDWASWDDSYEFMNAPNQRFIDANLTAESFIDNEVELMLFLDADGTPVLAQGHDPATGREIPVPVEALRPLVEARLRPGTPPEGVAGLVLLPDGPLLVSLRPIQDSRRIKPARGTLLWGRFLDAAEISRLGRSYRHDLDLRPSDDPNLPEDFQRARRELTADQPRLVLPLTEDVVAGYALLADLAGQPALILKCAHDRAIMTQGRETVSRVLWLLAGGGVLLGATLLVLMRLAVLSRLRRLVRDVERVRSGDSQIEIRLNGGDELTGLAQAVNRLLLDRRRIESRLARLALHDHLTGLPNRALFLDRLRHSLETAKRHSRLFALLYVDLDGFKPLNDAFGHAFGDAVLIETARRLRAGVRQADTVARVGGDEFALVLNDIAAPEDAMAVADKLLVLLGLPMDIDGRRCGVGASVGVSVYPHDGEDMDRLIQQADARMYRAKKNRSAPACSLVEADDSPAPSEPVQPAAVSRA